MKRNIIAYYDMLRITENVISDIPLPIVSDLNFFLSSSTLFLSYKKKFTRKEIYKPSTVSRVLRRLHRVFL